MRLTGNTVLITGGATGIGFSLAKALNEKGNTVIICGRRETRLIEAQQKCPGLVIKQCDISNEASRAELFFWISQNYESINILVNNAGILRDIDLSLGSGQLLTGENEIKVNLEAPIYLSSYFIPLLLTKKDSAIINISSDLGITPLVSSPVYSATKAGLHAFTKCLRAQLSKSGIKVFEVLPPGLDTELNLESRIKNGWGKTPSFGSLMPLNEYIEYVISSIENDLFEIMNPVTEDMKDVTLGDLDRIFEDMNSSWLK